MFHSQPIVHFSQLFLLLIVCFIGGCTVSEQDKEENSETVKILRKECEKITANFNGEGEWFYDEKSNICYIWPHWRSRLNTAREYCVRFGKNTKYYMPGNLISVSSASEMETITNKLGAWNLIDVWTGGHKSASTEGWVWPDGSKVTVDVKGNETITEGCIIYKHGYRSFYYFDQQVCESEALLYYFCEYNVKECQKDVDLPPHVFASTGDKHLGARRQLKCSKNGTDWAESVQDEDTLIECVLSASNNGQWKYNLTEEECYKGINGTFGAISGVNFMLNICTAAIELQHEHQHQDRVVIRGACLSTNCVCDSSSFNYDIQNISSETEIFRHGTELTVGCKPGHSWTLKTEQTTVKCENGTWTRPEHGAAPKCREGCKPPSNASTYVVPNRKTFPENSPHGEVLMIKCKSGHSWTLPSKTTNIECEDAAWTHPDGTLPECVFDMDCETTWGEWRPWPSTCGPRVRYRCPTVLTPPKGRGKLCGLGEIDSNDTKAVPCPELFNCSFKLEPECSDQTHTIVVMNKSIKGHPKCKKQEQKVYDTEVPCRCNTNDLNIPNSNASSLNQFVNESTGHVIVECNEGYEINETSGEQTIQCGPGSIWEQPKPCVIKGNATENEGEQASKGSTNVGLIVVVVILAVLLLAGAIGVIIWCVVKGRKNAEAEEKKENEDETEKTDAPKAEEK